MEVKILTLDVNTWRCGYEAENIEALLGTGRCGLKLRIEVETIDVLCWDLAVRLDVAD